MSWNLGFLRCSWLTTKLIRVNKSRMKTVLRQDKKKNSLLLEGHFLEAHSQLNLIAYRLTNAETPVTASIRTVCKCVKMWMRMRYAGSPADTPRIPSIVGTWPRLIAIPEPVMKPDTAGKAMKSTSQPNRRSPTNVTKHPERSASADAMTYRSYSFGRTSCACVRISPVTIERTATGFRLSELSPEILDLDRNSRQY
jgi:hypothetical protein